MQRVFCPRSVVWILCLLVSVACNLPQSLETPVAANLPDAAPQDQATAPIETLEATSTLDSSGSGGAVVQPTAPIIVSPPICITPTPLPAAYAGTPQPPCIGMPTGSTPAPGSIQVLSFTTDQKSIIPGEPITLRWKTTAQAVTVCQRKTVYDSGECRYELPPEGSVTLNSSPELAPQTIFDLITMPPVSMPQATLQVHYDARIILPQNCPNQWFFSNPPAGACPLTPVSIGKGLAQTFEHGMMIEVMATKQVYILMEDGSISGGVDGWTPDQPESDPQLIPPAGLYQPVQGLGLVWRISSDSRHFPPPRDALGWATAPQIEIQTDYQCDWAINVLDPNTPAPFNCWLMGQGGQIIVLYSDPLQDRYGWEIWKGP